MAQKFTVVRAYWRVESHEGGRMRPNGKFAEREDALRWASELAGIRETVLVWKCVKSRGADENRLLVARFEKHGLEGGSEWPAGRPEVI